MKIDFKDKKIVIPIIIFVGVLALVLLLYKEDDNAAVIEDSTEIKTDVGEVSKREVETPIDDKFIAYDNAVREQREKYTAINEIETEEIELIFNSNGIIKIDRKKVDDETKELDKDVEECEK